MALRENGALTREFCMTEIGTYGNDVEVGEFGG